MTRSPLAYPLSRGVDGDAGGAADLQTDIMRFMAILSLCLVAIFALVQSMPLTPTPPTPVPASEEPPPQPAAVHVPVQNAAPVPEETPAPEATPASPAEAVVLTRPKWQPKFTPTAKPETQVAPETLPVEVQQPVAAAEPREGFTLRFESDIALTRLVAASQVGFYAIAAGTAGGAKRMTVSDSRISFWGASTPNSFHEMEAATVPRPVVDALARSGVDTTTVDWGVTLPGKLSKQLDTLMTEHAGGSLVIAANGELRLERQ